MFFFSVHFETPQVRRHLYTRTETSEEKRRIGPKLSGKKKNKEKKRALTMHKLLWKYKQNAGLRGA